MLNQDWQIKPRSTTCLQCQKPFNEAQPYVSRLSFGDEGYLRADFCETCWASQSDHQDAVSVWHGIFRLPPPPPPEPIRKETAESLLRKFIENNDLTRKNVVFILAVMLERRRILVERDTETRPDGSLLRIYEHRKTGESFMIIDPGLDLNKLGAVQQEVMDLLSTDSQPPKENNAAQQTGPENNAGTNS